MRDFLKRHRRKLRIAASIAVAVVVTLAVGLVVCDRIVSAAGDGRCFADVALVPANRVGLVLGTNRVTAQGRPNVFYRARIDAAAALFAAGKVEFLLVSGDNGRREYDEATSMKDDLVARGVPADRVYRDFAGFRTLDSIVRAREVFGLTSLTVVSQRFHNERAIFLAREHGIDAVGFDAALRCSTGTALRMRAREVLARAAAMLDTRVFHRAPHFLGSPIVIGVSPDR